VLRTSASRSMFTAACAIGLVLSPVLVGLTPRDADPDLMYQPIKAELARALRAARLPFWSDRFGLGAPLVAESHVAAFYPPNWLFYRIWEVATAYRLTLWFHFVALGLSTYAYARMLQICPAGAAVAAVSFTLCGFQAAHAIHEPFYHVMPYLPLCLLLAECYLASARLGWLAALALAWGTQLTLGHFQIQMWTAALVLLTGAWRALTSSGAITRKAVRASGLVFALSWGLAIAWIQLRLTWELTGFGGFTRPPYLLANYSLPPAHLAQLALPAIFLGPDQGNAYWGQYGASPVEACTYVGIVPLVLSSVGLLAARRNQALNAWRLIVPLTLAVATMPGWWPDGFLALLQLPGLGWFRAPARYTLLTSLGLALLAGRGLDNTITARRFWIGLTLAIGTGAVAWAWSLHWTAQVAFQTGPGTNSLPARFAATAVAWGLGSAAIIAWRFGRLSSSVVLFVTALELGALFYVGPVRWDWATRLPAESPVLQRLAKLPDGGLIAGRLLNLPVVVDRTTAFPSLGITPPPPNYLLESATLPPANNSQSQRRWQRRLGVSYGIWGSRDDVNGTEVVAEIADPALDDLMKNNSFLKSSGLGPWKLVRNPDSFPSAWIARRTRVLPDWGQLYTQLSRADSTDEAWFLPKDLPHPISDPSAHAASIKTWDGKTAIIDHDGACVLILRQTFYPGWVYRINNDARRPVSKVNGGLQGVPLTRSGPSRVEITYQPTGLRTSIFITVAAVATAVATCAISYWKATKNRQTT
jgi:hypothetical protein